MHPLPQMAGVESVLARPSGAGRKNERDLQGSNLCGGGGGKWAAQTRETHNTAPAVYKLPGGSISSERISFADVYRGESPCKPEGDIR